MSPLGPFLAAWLLHALVVWASVALVTPGNPRNTIGRALLVTVIVAVIVTPAAYLWFLIFPAVIALICWIAVYKVAYGIGLVGAILVGIVQAGIDFLVDVLFLHGRLG